MPTTTRQKILDYAKKVRTVSAREIARTLGMTPANARRHLSILAADGRVELASTRQGVRGRPEKVYRLAGTLLGDNVTALAEALLTEADTGIDMDALGARMAGESTDASSLLADRLADTVQRLNEMQYQARWEAGGQGPRLILGHCPYAALIDSHPQLCTMDAALLGELLGGEVTQTAKLEPGAGGVPFCVFVVKGAERGA